MRVRFPLLRLVVAVVVALLAIGTLQATAEAATGRTLGVTASTTGKVVKGVVTFSGRLTSSPKGSPVTIQRKSGKRWVVAKATTTRTAAGAYAARVTLPATAGNYTYRAVAAKKGRLAAAASKAVVVAALRQVTVTIKATPPRVDAGDNATLTGTVRPFVAGATLVVQKLVGPTWVTAATTSLNAAGNFSKALPVTASTIFRAYVPRAGLNTSAVSLSTSVVADPVIATSSLPGGQVGGSYAATLTAVGDAPGTWTAAPLPAGLTLNGSTGTITGTPTTAGTTQVQIGFTHKFTAKVAAPKTLALQITQPVRPTITTPSLPEGLVGTPYSATLTAADGATGTWTTSPLPAGLSLDPSTGAITGTPTSAGTTAVTIDFTESGNPLPANSVTRDLLVTFPKPVITTTCLPGAKNGSAYSATLHVAGDVDGTWAVDGLPAGGLSLDPTTGVISGTAFSLFAPTVNLTVGFTATNGGAVAEPVHLTLEFTYGTPSSCG